jgi:hypothetical protein
MGEKRVNTDSIVGLCINYALIQRKQNFPHIKGNSDGIGCKVIYEEELPNIHCENSGR